MSKNNAPIDLRVAESVAVNEAQDTIRALEAELRERDRKIQTLLTENYGVDNFIASLADTVKAFPVAPKIAFPKATLRHDASTAILNLTDWHAEEYVDPREMEGYSKFDWDTFKCRLWFTGEKTLELVNIMRQAAPVDTLVVNCLGDMLTGSIHKELDETNTLDLPSAIPNTGWILAQMLQALAPHFKEIQVKCVAGNHGRMDDKPRFKKKAKRNWDTAVYRIAQILTRKDTSIVWDIPKSIALWYQIPGLRIVIKHGDEINSHGITPFYGITRDSAKEHAKRRGEKDFDVCFQGHLHCHAKVENRILCPSLIGTNEFAFYKLHAIDPPAQLLCFATAKHGLTCQWPIMLKGASHNDFVE